MVGKIDRNTYIPIGFAIVILGGTVSIAYFAGGFFERLSKFDPVRLEVRLSNIETEIAGLNKRFDKIDQRKVSLFFPHQEIADKSTAPEAEREYGDQKDVLRHYPPPVRIPEPLMVDQWGMR